MFIAIDIGNSSIHFGAFDGKRLAAEWRITTTAQRTPDEYGVQMLEFLKLRGLGRKPVETTGICSVVPTLTPAFAEAAETYFRCRVETVNEGTDTGLKIRYREPKDVGADRIVNAVAVYHENGGPAIIVDFGTATTLDVVTAKGEYLGGAITPGVMISAEALFSKAAKLPVVELGRPRFAVGRDPISSIQSGVILGYASLVDGMVARFRREVGENARVVATGGLATMILPESTAIQDYRPHLTLEGLHYLFGGTRRSAPRLKRHGK